MFNFIEENIHQIRVKITKFWIFEITIYLNEIKNNLFPFLSYNLAYEQSLAEIHSSILQPL